LLQLLARLHNTASAPDTGDLRERVLREMRAFEQRALLAGVPMEVLRPAHYALCASIDDVVMNTPWGNEWKQRTLLSAFHQGTAGGRHFFDLLGRLRLDPGRFLPAIEVMYLCLSLGYLGPYRPPNGDHGGWNQLRSEICSVIVAQRGGGGGDLSPRWKGVSAPYRARRRIVPIWVAAAAAMAVCGGFFLWVSAGVNAASDAVQTRLVNEQPDHMPRIGRVAPAPPPAPVPFEAGALDRLTAALNAEIAAGQVTVAGTTSAPVLRIAERALFPAGGATLLPAAGPLLGRIAAALKPEHAPLELIGYTDNQKIHTVKFPSSFELSLARAKAVGSVIGRSLGDETPIATEGRNDADPISPNDTAEGRERNRRIEIILHPPSQSYQ
jgi:type VI secretion system protein ImpK